MQKLTEFSSTRIQIWYNFDKLYGKVERSWGKWVEIVKQQNYSKSRIISEKFHGNSVRITEI